MSASSASRPASASRRATSSGPASSSRPASTPISAPRPHAAVKNELLVRYLDAWAPAMLHGHRRVTYLEVGNGDSSAAAALRVFGEFADLLDQHTVTMMLASDYAPDLDAVATRLGAMAAEFGSPPGLVVRTTAGIGTVVAALTDAKAVGSPIFGRFDGYQPGALDAVLAAVAGNKSSEVLVSLPVPAGASCLKTLGRAGASLTASVELVSADGHDELLIFAAASERTLERFKDELWALDEFAGIQYRDPHDDEHTLLDISLQPHLGPLRRALVARIGDVREATVAELRGWALHHTVFRGADATKALQSLVASRAVTREPASGRLSADTLIRPRHRG